MADKVTITEDGKHKLMTEAELMVTPNDTLSFEELQRKVAMATLRKTAMEAEKVAAEVRAFEIKRIDEARAMQARIQAVKDQEARIKWEQTVCKHMTGGTGLENWGNGDGKTYGASTSPQETVIGEKYFLCWRCLKEWWLPSKRAVIEGRLEYADYLKAEKEYLEQVKAQRVSMSVPSDQGSNFGGVGPRFRVPKLERRRDQDNADFEVWKKKNAHLVAEGMQKLMGVV